MTAGFSPRPLEAFQHLQNAGEALAPLGAQVPVDSHIIAAHPGPVLFVGLRAHHPADEHLHAVADVPPVLLRRVLGQAGNLQGGIGAEGDIRQGIQEGSIQVK